MLCKNTHNCVESIYTVLRRKYLLHVPSGCCFLMHDIKAFQDGQSISQESLSEGLLYTAKCMVTNRVDS